MNRGVQELLLDSVRRVQIVGESTVSSRGEEIAENSFEDFSSQDLGELTPEIRSYIRHLRSRLSATKKVSYLSHWVIALNYILIYVFSFKWLPHCKSLKKF